MTKNLIIRAITLWFALTALCSCEYIARYRCEWYLVPEPDHRNIVEPGWVSVCLRNFEINKQKCYLKAKLEFAEEYYGKLMRYVDVEVSRESWPHEVTKIKTCSK